MTLDRKDAKAEIDEMLIELALAVGRALIRNVEEGKDLRAAIDWLRLNRRSVTEADVVGSSKDASGYLNDLLSQIDDEGGYRR